jgi:septal ring factor EnvC (AmiA/AmiB activator)
MWPKVLMQLFELLPHVTRLVPLADRYFSAKAATESANEAALAAMAEGVRGDLGQVTAAHAGLYRKLQEQGNQIADLSEDIRTARSAVEQSERRIEVMDRKIASISLWLKVSVSLVAILLVLVVVLLARGH